MKIKELASAKKKTVKTFSFEEVFQKTILYFDGDDLAATTWINKYAMKDFNGNYVEQTPEDMHIRMAYQFARIEQKYRDRIAIYE